MHVCICGLVPRVGDKALHFGCVGPDALPCLSELVRRVIACLGWPALSACDCLSDRLYVRLLEADPTLVTDLSAGPWCGFGRI
jgi:hypothetical protein